MIFRNNNFYKLCVIITLCIGFLARLIGLGDIPGNGALNQDEAYGGYEAWSMLNYGHDSRGYPNFPVYLKTWGAGMSLLPNVSMMPFIKLLDLTPLAIRLPQAILGCISLVVFYLLVSRVRGKDVGLVALFLLSIVPWHVMMSRWGLDCNFFPGFLLISIYFLVKSTERKIYLYLSMIFFGLTFYTYAAPWVVLPFLITHLYIYIMRKNQLFKKKIFGLHTFLCIFILLIFAIPIICLYLLNINLIHNISLPFFSVPIISMRYNDVNFSFYKLLIRLKAIYDLIIINQSDFLFQNSPSYKIGIYYKFSTPFFIIGIFYEFIKQFNFSKNFKIQKLIFPYSKIFLIWFFYAFILSLLIDVNIGRINIIHLTSVFFIAQGIVVFSMYFKRLISIKFSISILVIVYIYNFFNFMQNYFTVYNKNFYDAFNGDLKQVVEYLKNSGSVGKIIHISNVSYPNLLFYLKYPTDKYIKSANFVDDKSTVQHLLKFDNFDLTDFSYSKYNNNDIYITVVDDKKQVSYIYENAKNVEKFGKFIIGRGEI